MKTLRKSSLLIIITMSLFLTSGTSISLLAQQRLENTLNTLQAKNVQAEITFWVPVGEASESPNNSSDDVFKLLPGWTRDVRRVSEQISGRGLAFDITTLKTAQSSDLVKVYKAVRTRAMSIDIMGQRGGAYLGISMDVAAKNSKKQLGKQALGLLGGNVKAQEMENANLYSVASVLPGWGQPVRAGTDEINLQLIVRSGSSPNITHLYLLAPTLRGDL